jgi:hypothetical protein
LTAVIAFVTVTAGAGNAVWLAGDFLLVYNHPDKDAISRVVVRVQPATRTLLARFNLALLRDPRLCHGSPTNTFAVLRSPVVAKVHR